MFQLHVLKANPSFNLKFFIDIYFKLGHTIKS